jgi:crossover junction endodeoxyribonuclease RuvC
MKILAFDPGYDRLGAAVLEHTDGKEALLFSECIITDKNSDLSDRILDLGTQVIKLIEKYSPDAVAMETLFFNKNIKTAIGVAQARGAVLFLAKQSGCPVYEYGPQEIKIAVTGYGKSDKAAVIDMVKRLVKNAPEKAHDDEYDAIAVGITALSHNRT